MTRFDRAGITSLLRTDRFGRELHFYKEVGSTSLIAQELARKGEGEGTPPNKFPSSFLLCCVGLLLPRFLHSYSAFQRFPDVRAIRGHAYCRPWIPTVPHMETPRI